jgi:hypothetical protein
MKTKLFLALLAGVLLLGACKGSNYEAIRDEKAVSKSDAALTNADSTSVVTASTKLVKTADMSFKVKNVQQTGDAIAALTTKINGMVMHHQM